MKHWLNSASTPQPKPGLEQHNIPELTTLDDLDFDTSVSKAVAGLEASTGQVLAGVGIGALVIALLGWIFGKMGGGSSSGGGGGGGGSISNQADAAASNVQKLIDETAAIRKRTEEFIATLKGCNSGDAFAEYAKGDTPAQKFFAKHYDSVKLHVIADVALYVFAKDHFEKVGAAAAERMIKWYVSFVNKASDEFEQIMATYMLMGGVVDRQLLVNVGVSSIISEQTTGGDILKVYEDIRKTLGSDANLAAAGFLAELVEGREYDKFHGLDINKIQDLVSDVKKLNANLDECKPALDSNIPKQRLDLETFVTSGGIVDLESLIAATADSVIERPKNQVLKALQHGRDIKSMKMSAADGGELEAKLGIAEDHDAKRKLKLIVELAKYEFILGVKCVRVISNTARGIFHMRDNAGKVSHHLAKQCAKLVNKAGAESYTGSFNDTGDFIEPGMEVSTAAKIVMGGVGIAILLKLLHWAFSGGSSGSGGGGGGGGSGGSSSDSGEQTVTTAAKSTDGKIDTAVVVESTPQSAETIEAVSERLEHNNDIVEAEFHEVAADAEEVVAAVAAVRNEAPAQDRSKEQKHQFIARHDSKCRTPLARSVLTMYAYSKYNETERKFHDDATDWFLPLFTSENPSTAETLMMAFYFGETIDIRALGDNVTKHHEFKEIAEALDDIDKNLAKNLKLPHDQPLLALMIGISEGKQQELSIFRNAPVSEMESLISSYSELLTGLARITTEINNALQHTPKHIGGMLESGIKFDKDDFAALVSDDDIRKVRIGMLHNYNQYRDAAEQLERNQDGIAERVGAMSNWGGYDADLDRKLSLLSKLAAKQISVGRRFGGMILHSMDAKLLNGLRAYRAVERYKHFQSHWTSAAGTESYKDLPALQLPAAGLEDWRDTAKSAAIGTVVVVLVLQFLGWLFGGSGSSSSGGGSGGGGGGLAAYDRLRRSEREFNTTADTLEDKLKGLASARETVLNHENITAMPADRRAKALESMRKHSFLKMSEIVWHDFNELAKHCQSNYELAVAYALAKYMDIHSQVGYDRQQIANLNNAIEAFKHWKSVASNEHVSLYANSMLLGHNLVNVTSVVHKIEQFDIKTKLGDIQEILKVVSEIEAMAKNPHLEHSAVDGKLTTIESLIAQSRQHRDIFTSAVRVGGDTSDNVDYTRWGFYEHNHARESVRKVTPAMMAEIAAATDLVASKISVDDSMWERARFNMTTACENLERAAADADSSLDSERRHRIKQVSSEMRQLIMALTGYISNTKKVFDSVKRNLDDVKMDAASVAVGCNVIDRIFKSGGFESYHAISATVGIAQYYDQIKQFGMSRSMYDTIENIAPGALAKLDPTMLTIQPSRTKQAVALESLTTYMRKH